MSIRIAVKQHRVVNFSERNVISWTGDNYEADLESTYRQ